MKRSKFIVKTRKDDPADEVSVNAKLLTRAGFIHKEMAGVYSYLPLGLITLEKIIQIIREEMNNIGAYELHMASLQDSQNWLKTNEWSEEAVDIWFKTKLKNNTEIGLGYSHEAAMTNMMKSHIASHRDLPVYMYQFQTKFRNETRAKSGILRCREFLMKDLYSFCQDEAQHEAFYDKVTNAYQVIFDRIGIGNQTYLTFAAGGTFAKFSHEFQTITEAGEDTIYLDKDKKLAINKEVFSDELVDQLGLNKDSLQELKGAEVGNIFSLNDKYSVPHGLLFADETGEMKPVIMGSYGIGPGRVMGVVAELMSDDKGLVWPRAIAPADVYLIDLTGNQGEEMYELLTQADLSIIYDDRDESAGQKFSEADLMGIPWRVVLSEKAIEAGGVELKNRASGEITIVPIEKLIETLRG